MTSTTNTCSSYTTCVLYGLVLLLGWASRICDGFGTFGFDIHHRYSDPVKEILAVDGLPEKGSLDYYVAMAHRDRIIHGRRLATTAQNQTLLAFFPRNETYRIAPLGFLHYANVSVGTPSLSFLVALDTGSDLFWLPCDCSSCVRAIKTRNDVIELNIYSPNASTTSTEVPCNSTLCQNPNRCSAASDNCPYQIRYLSNGTSTTGVLVEDLLHLTTDNAQLKAVDAPITFGCGKVQTGSFLEGGAPNGLFGLGIENVSVPSILAKQGLVSDSFSMCFGHDGRGRISFGDKGSTGQGETPFNLRQLHPTYNISITQISVGGNAANLEFSAIFDSGTSFTYLNDPAYTSISESFNLQAQDKRRSSDPSIPFEYCYDISSNQTSISAPVVDLTMKGGDQLSVADPIVLISTEGGMFYCLGIVKSGDVNIIGQNFMTGYRIVFDRERMVLGWKASNCYDVEESNTLPVNPPSLPPIPPVSAFKPEATGGSNNNSPASGSPPPMSNQSPKLNSFTYALAMVPFLIVAIF